MARQLTYSETSGQVFTEVTVAATKRIPWWNNRSGKPENPFTYRRSGFGASSLYDAALRVCAFNAEWISPEALVCAEWPYAERIHRRLKERDALTFKIWKIFREAFPEVAELDHSYQVRIAAQPTERPSGELASIHRQITTLPFPALTNIDIRNLRLRHVHLMDLTNFPNLAVLALEQNLDQAGPRGESGIDEQFMKRWALLVREKKAFLKLTVIIFRHFRIALDSTLDCFGSFPCLLLCNADTIYPLQNPAGMAKTWQPLSIECELAKNSRENPQRIWTRSTKTVHEKMTKLYELVSKVSSNSKAKSSSVAVVSIHYGEGRHQPDKITDSAWFFREAPSPGDLAQPEKRPNDSDSSLEGKHARVDKKRKIRANKQTDIGSLLGLLGPT